MAAEIGISNFTSYFKDGLRPNLFYVQMQGYSGNNGGSKINLDNLGLSSFQFFCKGASLPASTIGSIEVPYMGRSIKVAGNRTFEDWTVTVYNATIDNSGEGQPAKKSLRRPFETWMSYINSHNTNIGYNRIASYKSDAIIKHLDQRGNCIAAYKMIGIFPTEVSSIDLAWDSNDTIEEFTVTFALGEYWALSSDNTTKSNSEDTGTTAATANNTGTNTDTEEETDNDYTDFAGDGA